jgi:hypothetical protein
MESPRRGFALCVSALAALLSRPCWAGSSGPDPLQVQMHHPAHGNMVLMALHGAYRKLGKPACQQVLDDFQDSEGRTLRENLEPLGIEAAEYLSLLTYREGRDLASGRCRKGGVAAVTHPGDRVVFVCIASFGEQPQGIRENTLIHEMLHSLGLGENPPSSSEINGQVLRRCGS